MKNLPVSLKGQEFQFEINNTSGATKRIALMTAFFAVMGFDITQAGVDPFAVSAISPHMHDTTAIDNNGLYDVDAILDDGEIAAGVTCTALDSRFSIREFLQYFRNGNEAILREIAMQTTNDDQFEKKIIISKHNPCKKNGDDVLSLSKYYDPNQDNKTKLIVPGLEIALNDERIMIMPIDTDRKLTFTFRF